MPNINGNEIIIITYKDGLGVLREILMSATRLGFQASLSDTRQIERPNGAPRVEATIQFRGRRPLDDLVGELSELRGVSSVHLSQDVPE
jgi:putative Mg2+ transporter-C (MgtC) family protein